MTDADVLRVVRAAADRGINIDPYDAAIFLGAKELAERGENTEIALRVVEQYTRLITTGQRPTSFDFFRLPERAFYTTEQLDAMRQSREAYLAATEKKPQ